MPRGKGLSDKQKEVIYTQSTMGESPEDIAWSMDLNPGTVRRIIREQRKLHEKMGAAMARSGKIVKKDGHGGKLMALTPDGFEFIHVTPDGKSHKKKVPGHISRVAEQQYDQWCEELDDECEFMRKVERKESEKTKDDEPFVPTDEPMEFEDFLEDEPDDVDITPAPVPEINVRPWREVAEERQKKIEELEARIAQLEDKERVLSVSDMVIADTEGETPKLGHWFNNNGSFRVFWMDKPVYVLWAKAETPRLFGVYHTMESALKEVDKLNEVAAFLGNGDAFTVEEVSWKFGK